jgi:hypothetical protein
MFAKLGYPHIFSASMLRGQTWITRTSSILTSCSRQSPHCTAAARIPRKLLALRNIRSQYTLWVFRFRVQVEVSFKTAWMKLKEHQQSAPNVVHAWLETAGDCSFEVMMGKARIHQYRTLRLKFARLELMDSRISRGVRKIGLPNMP